MRGVVDLGALRDGAVLDRPVAGLVLGGGELQAQVGFVRVEHELVPRAGLGGAHGERAALELGLHGVVDVAALVGRDEVPRTFLHERYVGRLACGAYAFLPVEGGAGGDVDRCFSRAGDVDSRVPGHGAHEVHDESVAARQDAHVALVDRVVGVELDSLQSGRDSAIGIERHHAADRLVEDRGVALLRRGGRVDEVAIAVLDLPVVLVEPVVGIHGLRAAAVGVEGLGAGGEPHEEQTCGEKEQVSPGRSKCVRLHVVWSFRLSF